MMDSIIKRDTLNSKSKNDPSTIAIDPLQFVQNIEQSVEKDNYLHIGSYSEKIYKNHLREARKIAFKPNENEELEKWLIEKINDGGDFDQEIRK